MPVLGITGGIATGKTTFTGALRSVIPGELFDADVCARELIEKDRFIRLQVVEQFGQELLTPQGTIRRDRLREIAFHDRKQRRKLEAILHPVIRRSWLPLAAKFSRAKEWLFVDIPLLYETSAEEEFDAIVVVACSDQTQQLRLITKRKLTDSMSPKIIAAQLPLSEKIARADFLIWNEGSVNALQCQAAFFGRYLISRYG